MQIFVSSVGSDLRTERETAISQILKLGDRPIAMEHFGSTFQPPLEECLAKVEDSDLVILILGPSYGSVHAGTGISYTENEFNHAKQIGIDVLVFIVEDLGPKIDATNASDSATKYQRFFREVQGSQTYEQFSNPDRLAAAVATGISNYKKGHGELGRRLAPFVSWKEVFQVTLDQKKLFNHTWTLVGRKDVLDSLNAFARSNKNIGILYGPAGLGKSRVLLEFARAFDESISGWLLRFLREFTPWNPEIPKALPAGPVLIVIDDAHRYLDLEAALSFVHSAKYSNRTKFLLTARPSGKQAIDAILGRAADISEVADLGKLSPLPRDEVTKLVLQTLDAHTSHYADRLVHVSWDSPLVSVIGGGLVREKQLRPELFATDDEFKKAVFTRFADELTKSLPGNPETWKKLLVLISALGPIRPVRTELRDALSTVLKLEPWDLLEKIAQLEQNGILLRRGGLVQISPDVLGDYLLDSACVIAGQDTGFATNLFEHFVSIQAENLLRNLAEVQWRIDQTVGTPQLLKGIWANIRSEFDAADMWGKLRILKIVEEAAAYQPDQALEIVRRAIKSLAKTGHESET
jgi:hypothetical protein